MSSNNNAPAEAINRIASAFAEANNTLYMSSYGKGAEYYYKEALVTICQILNPKAKAIGSRFISLPSKEDL